MWWVPLARIADFLLGANCQDEHGVEWRDVSIQRDISVAIATDYQFAQVAGRWTTDQRIAGEHVDRMQDLVDAQPDRGRIMSCQVIENALEVIQHARSEFNA